MNVVTGASPRPAPHDGSDGGLAGSRPETVLVADDDASVRRLVGLALELEGFTVVSAADGHEALTAATVDGCLPHAVVLDAAMPGMDGLEVCRRLRAIPGRSPAVVMITGRTDLVDRLAAFESGVDDYVVKPVRVVELVERVRALIDGRAAPPPQLLGGPEATNALERRARAGAPVGVALIETVGLAAFARRYSFPRAERLLAFLGNLLVEQAGTGPGTIVARLGGEEFLIAGEPGVVGNLVDSTVARFDVGVGRFYDPEDARRGYIEVVDRRGTLHRHRLVRLVAGVTASGPARPLHHLDLLGRAAELARHARTHGPVAVDRRLGP